MGGTLSRRRNRQEWTPGKVPRGSKDRSDSNGTSHIKSNVETTSATKIDAGNDGTNEISGANVAAATADITGSQETAATSDKPVTEPTRQPVDQPDAVMEGPAPAVTEPLSQAVESTKSEPSTSESTATPATTSDPVVEPAIKSPAEEQKQVSTPEVRVDDVPNPEPLAERISREVTEQGVQLAAEIIAANAPVNETKSEMEQPVIPIQDPVPEPTVDQSKPDVSEPIAETVVAVSVPEPAPEPLMGKVEEVAPVPESAPGPESAVVDEVTPEPASVPEAAPEPRVETVSEVGPEPSLVPEATAEPAVPETCPESKSAAGVSAGVALVAEAPAPTVEKPEVEESKPQEVPVAVKSPEQIAEDHKLLVDVAASNADAAAILSAKEKTVEPVMEQQAVPPAESTNAPEVPATTGEPIVAADEKAEKSAEQVAEGRASLIDTATTTAAANGILLKGSAESTETPALEGQDESKETGTTPDPVPKSQAAKAEAVDVTPVVDVVVPKGDVSLATEEPIHDNNNAKGDVAPVQAQDPQPVEA